MVQRYIETASVLMSLADLCADEEAANILREGSLKIFQLAESHGVIIKRAKLKTEPESE